MDEVLLAHCMDPERGLPSLESESVDLIVTDPPYSSGGLHRRDRSLKTSDKYQSSDAITKHTDFAHDNKDQRSFTSWSSWWLEECLRVAKRDARLVVFSDWRQLPAMSDAIQWAGWIWHGVAVWSKGNGRPTMRGFGSHQEFMLWASKEALPVSGADVYAPSLPGVLEVSPPRGDERIHMTQKPDDLLEKIVMLAPPRRPCRRPLRRVVLGWRGGGSQGSSLPRLGAQRGNPRRRALPPAHSPGATLDVRGGVRMIIVHLPNFATPDAALDWLDGQGETIRVYLMRGPDGMLRGSAIIHPKAGRP